MPLTADPSAAVTLDDVRAAAARARGRRRPHPARRGARAVAASRRPGLAQVRAAPADRRLQDPRRLYRHRPAAAERPAPAASSPTPAATTVRPWPTSPELLRHPGGDRDAGATPADQGRGRPAARRRGGVRRHGPLAGAEAAGRGDRGRGRTGHDSAVRASRRDRGAGHLRPRDPGAAARRRDHPGRRWAAAGCSPAIAIAVAALKPTVRIVGGRAGRRRQAHRRPRGRATRSRWSGPRAWPTGCSPARSAS